MQPTPRALVFDVDGTLADTERYHLQAFNEAFAGEGLDWRWDPATYTRLLEVSGGKERMLAYWQEVRGGTIVIEGNAMRDLIDRVHLAKTAIYEALVKGGAVRMRPGVMQLLEDAQRHGVALAIATTTSPVNVAALLREAFGPQWRLHFPVVCDASTAPRKKPHPLVYQQALQGLGMPAEACIAFEDSANGLRAARAAGMDTVVTPTAFTRHHDFTGALRVLPSLVGVGIAELAAWRAEQAETAGALP